MSKEHFASDPELRSLQLRWATDDLWIRRIEVVATLLAVASLVVAIVVVVMAHPESGVWYGVTPTASATCGLFAYMLRRMRRGDPRGFDPAESAETRSQATGPAGQ
jgi:hypothetical protein